MDTKIEVSNKVRQSNFELLRILSMLMIVAHHFGVHSGWQGGGYPNFNIYLIRFLSIGGKIGVNLFILISGYFLITSKFSIKKLIKLILQTVFYSLLFYIIFASIGMVQFSFYDLIRSIFAIATNQYWFVSCYVIMYILSPFINKALLNSSKKAHLGLIAVLLLFQSVYPFIFNENLFSNVGWFITVYVIASYIKLYSPKILDKKAFYIPVTLVLLVVIACCYMFFYINLWEFFNLVCVVFCVALFCWFKNIKIKNNKFINTISKTTLGVYLIHDNGLFRRVLWNRLLNAPFHATLNSFVLFALVAIIVVFAGCSVIDLLRDLLDKLCTKLVNKIKEKKKNPNENINN